MRKLAKNTLIAAFLAMILAGCGQMGALYHPTESPPATDTENE